MLRGEREHRTLIAMTELVAAWSAPQARAAPRCRRCCAAVPSRGAESALRAHANARASVHI
eukprot:6196350-Pleurochrysis_carterae.AAC.3